MSRPVVVKVGGSLFDLPDLRQRLNHYLNLPKGPLVIVPGGGSVVDSVRHLDQTHHLGETASHWMALKCLSVNALMLSELIGGSQVATSIEELPIVWNRAKYAVVDPYLIARNDELNPDQLPACWNATSDSVAGRIAVLCGASELVLLKSATALGETLKDWAAAGYIDPLLQCVLGDAKIKVQAVNLRTLQLA